MIRFEAIRPKKPAADRRRILAAINQAVQDTTSEGHRFISKYPPQTLTKSGYRRTMTLGRSWSSRVNFLTDRTEGIIGSNANMAPYNKWVQGLNTQVPRYKTAGWKGVKDLQELLKKELPKRLQEAVRHVL